MVNSVKKIAMWEVRLLYMFLIGLMALGAYSVYNTNHQAYLACIRVQKLQGYAVQTIIRGEKTLPTLAYYRNPDHKQELKTQLRLSEQSRKDFKPVTCHKNVFGG